MIISVFYTIKANLKLQILIFLNCHFFFDIAVAKNTTTKIKDGLDKQRQKVVGNLEIVCPKLSIKGSPLPGNIMTDLKSQGGCFKLLIHVLHSCKICS